MRPESLLRGSLQRVRRVYPQPGFSHIQKKPRGPAPANCTTRISVEHDGQNCFLTASPPFSAVFAFFSAISCAASRSGA